MKPKGRGHPVTTLYSDERRKLPMKRYLIPVMLISVLGVVLAAEEATLAKRYRTLVGEYQADKQSYVRALAAAETSAAKRQAEARRPKAEDFARRFLELAKTDLSDTTAFDALFWITIYSPRGAQADEAMELLATNQLKELRLGSVLQNLGSSPSVAAEKLLRAALESSPHREVRALACYNLATVLMTKAGVKGGAKASRKTGEKNPKEKSAESTKQPIDSSQDEAVELLERLAADYGDVKIGLRKNYGDLSRVNLDRLRPKSAGKAASVSLPVSLEIGSVAPEILGTDTEGRKMRLSDYRGKVVVLDFWGDW
jgi:AhpC/TSA family